MSHERQTESKLRIKDIGELGLIEQIKREIGFSDKLFIPIGDDAAAFELRPPLFTLLTTDSQVKNVHFKMDTISPEDLGFKALSVNISDIAAMAGIPKYAVIALGLEASMEVDYISSFYKGLKEAADYYNIALAGGDISSSYTFFINITVLGEVEPSLIRRRGEATPGDLIYVTGQLGGSAAGLKVLDESLEVKEIDYLVSKHNRPVAKITDGRLASENGAKAMEDISDGLLTELKHICDESGTGAVIEASDIPVDDKIFEVTNELGIDPLQFALGGGEDYELVFTVNKDESGAIEEVFDLENKPLFKIGRITDGKNIIVLDKNGNNLSFTQGWEHLK
jgi:thiamine-monophosphate kinase